MCGIAGFWDFRQNHQPEKSARIIQSMIFPLAHRGPDHDAFWLDANLGLALGHRRLAILDLSPSGHQPMMDGNQRFVLVFNGEIYNFHRLRQELTSLGHTFSGTSDTEVMLASFCQWGVMEAVQRFHGMFAFALWDQKEQVLHLGRDRMGEKPLYYGWLGQSFIFGSELKALTVYPGWQGDVNRQALALLMQHAYVPDPLSIYQGIYKLPPATILSLPAPTAHPNPIAYWSAQQMVESAVKDSFDMSDAAATARLDEILRQAVSQQMVADVPIGAFLSGGVDSSAVVALMQAQRMTPIKTFSIGFEDPTYNEAPYAQAVAQHLGTDHTDFYVQSHDVLNIIPQLPTLYDEPFADSSQIPTFLVAKLARQSVTIALSGDGGDELFGGYNRYLWGPKIWQRIGWLPPQIRQGLGQLILPKSPNAWSQWFTDHHQWIPKSWQPVHPGEKLHKLANSLSAQNAAHFYTQLSAQWKDSTALVLDSQPVFLLQEDQVAPNLPDLKTCMMFWDLITYLPGDILTKLDRACMGISLETRLPFLDPQVIEFAWQLSPSMRIRGGQTKWLLRQVLNQYVPKNLIERPKMGFGIPIEKWLRGPLRDWAESLLNEQRLQQEGFLQPQLVRQTWAEHLRGDCNWQHHLWNVLMFQSWLENQANPSMMT